MKKIFTLFIALGALTSVFAQSGHQKSERNSSSHNDARTAVLGRTNNDHGYNDSYTYSSRQKEDQIRQINHEFDAKVNAVKYNRRLRASEKNRQIRMLENQRTAAIRQANDRFQNSRNTYNHRSSGNDYTWKH